MEHGLGKRETFEKKIKGEVHSKAVRAGKRTYFFDVKATRWNDNYLTITESKKRFNKEGRFYYEKHKIFLYREDFKKFVEGLNEALEFIETNCPEETAKAEMDPEMEEITESYTNVEFEDLDRQND